MIIESILLNTMLSLQHVDQTSGIVPLYYFIFFLIKYLSSIQIGFGLI